jgi:hypothetical protein
MSEFQLYEFRALDRALTRGEMSTLRTLSTRAEISSTRFYNTYSWGDFRGNPDELMDRFFDLFLYRANWGTWKLMLRFPKTLLDPSIVEQYCLGETQSHRLSGSNVILSYWMESESEWVEEDDNDISSYIQIRSDLMLGDYRALYLGWLATMQSEESDEEEIEPPVPPGLQDLEAAYEDFVSVLEIDEALLHVAAQASAKRVEVVPSKAVWQRWVEALPQKEKDELLITMLSTNSIFPLIGLQQRFARERAPVTSKKGARRTVAELTEAAEVYRKELARKRAEEKAREKARKEKEAAELRARYLSTLVGREEELWRQIEVLAQSKNASQYDRAASLVKDLYDLSKQQKQSTFQAKYVKFCETYRRQYTLIERLRKI